MAKPHYRIQGDYGRVMAALNDLYQRDKFAEVEASRLRTRGLILLLVSLVGGFGSVFVLPFLLVIHWGALLAGIALVGGLVVAMFVIGIRSFAAASRIAKDDVEDRKLDVPGHFLERLRPELAGAMPIDLHLDFRPHATLPPVRQERLMGGALAVEYEHHWLYADLTLLDGTRATLSVTSSVKEKLKRKRKYTKRRSRVTELIRIALTPAKGRRFTSQHVRSGFVANEGVRLIRAKVRPKRAELTWSTVVAQSMRNRYGTQTSGGSATTPTSLIGALVSSYRLVGAGAGSKAA